MDEFQPPRDSYFSEISANACMPVRLSGLLVFWGLFVRIIGFLILAAGIIGLMLALSMETSVETSIGFFGSRRIENIGLIAQRQNYLMVASLVTLIGALMAIFGGEAKESETEMQSLSHPVGPSNPPCDRDLTIDAYQLWLAAKYKIERNELFDKFVFQDQMYDSLCEALASAHIIEMENYESNGVSDVSSSKSTDIIDEEFKDGDINIVPFFIGLMVLGFIALAIVAMSK